MAASPHEKAATVNRFQIFEREFKETGSQSGTGTGALRRGVRGNRQTTAR
jgi:hypothetical protein